MATFKLAPNALRPPGGVWHTWEVVLPAGTSKDDVFRADFWANNVNRLPPMTRVVFITQDMEFEGEVLVLDSGVGFARVVPIRFTQIQASDAQMPDESPLKVEWKAPRLKYAVIRKGDGEIMKSGFAQRHDAEAWAINHLKAMAA